MGQIRLFVGACADVQQIEPLPEHWDELDNDEKKEWAESRLAEFGSNYVTIGYKISE